MTDSHAPESPAEDSVADPVPEHDVIASIPGTEGDDQSERQAPAPDGDVNTEQPVADGLYLHLDKKVVRALRDTFIAVADGRPVTIVLKD